VGGQQIAGSDINVSNVGGWLLTPGKILLIVKEVLGW
jgi:hypothetical protein